MRSVPPVGRTQPQRILIALGERLPPQGRGGSQATAFEIAAEFRKLGHVCAVAGTLARKSASGLLPSLKMVVQGRTFARGRVLGIPVYRIARKAAFREVLADFAPDLALVHGMSGVDLALTCVEGSVPTTLYWHDVELHKLSGSPLAAPMRFVANSRFTADVYASAFGIESVVVPPLFRAERVRPALRVPDQRVLFVGTVPDKGLDIALAVAELSPDIPFLFVESWVMASDVADRLRQALKHLPNVEFLPFRRDMREVYARTRLLLVPSQWQEAWGRVASEAHANGVPVIASNIGGLPESVGPGGVLVDPKAPAARWALEVQRLWRDEAAYARLSAAALAYAQRDELDPEWAARKLLDVMSSAPARWRRPADAEATS